MVEYLDGDAKWEQIFITYEAFIREVKKVKHCTQEEAEKKYLMTEDELKEKMKDKPYNSDKYKKFFNDEIKSHLAGSWTPNNEKFYNIRERSSVWLVGGLRVYFDQYGWASNNNDKSFGFSGRLLKN